ncbi:MAG TPA: ABC transporter substrate-binding protein [Solirubrobacteraceae bacterium]|nr:ABC transporter substrate-binding protein [Solirubrobacteraceae bacterium]
MTRRLILTLIALLATVALAACGEKKDVIAPSSASPQPVSLMLDWTPNADHVGLYRALATGAFRNAGLDVHVHVPTDPATPLQLLAAGKVDVAISYEPEVLLARDKGLPIASIGAIVQRPLTSIVSLGARHITAPTDLKGKTVGTAGIPYQHAYLESILQRNGVRPSSVHEVNVGANLVGSMLSGRVDATLGAYWNYEALQLRQMGRRVNVIHVEQAGVPTYDELVVVARTGEIASRNDMLRRFIQALGRGYESVRSDPAAGVASLDTANPGLDARLQKASVAATLSSFFPAPGKPWGWQSPAQWTAYGQWMLAHHLITNASAVVGAETNQLLAGQGP